MNCPHCDQAIADELVVKASQSIISKRPRGVRTAVVCPLCGETITRRELKRRPKCPHKGEKAEAVNDSGASS